MQGHHINSIIGKSWKTLSADALLPGDIVSITRELNTCPADLLLLSGGCVVNEAMLTGESTPHHKVII